MTQNTAQHYARTWREAVPQPRGSRARLRSAARGLALSAAARTTGRPEAPFCRCVYCHYVFDDQIEDFRDLLVALQQDGQFIDTASCLAMASGERPIDGGYFHLSFDDGFLNNLANAVPVLEELGIPAIFFLPTDFIGADAELARRYCVDIAAYKAPIEMMDWADVEDLSARGFEIGSHTRSHARLSDVSRHPQQLADELQGSKRTIEERLGKDCDYIAWPFGTPSDIDAAGLAAVEAAGYRANFGAFRGQIEAGQTDLLRVPRHHFEPQWPIAHSRFFARGHFERSP